MRLSMSAKLLEEPNTIKEVSIEAKNLTKEDETKVCTKGRILPFDKEDIPPNVKFKEMNMDKDRAEEECMDKVLHEAFDFMPP